MWIVMMYDTRNGDPITDYSPSSPEVCERFCEAHIVIGNPKAVISRVMYQAKQSGVVLGDEFPPVLDDMNKGQWLEMGRARHDNQLRLYVVKVAERTMAKYE